MKRIMAAFLCILVLGCSVSGYAQDIAGDGNISFNISDIKTPSGVRQNTNNAHRHDKTGDKSVYYYGMLRRPETLENDAFESCYSYMCYGTGNEIDNVSDNKIAFNFSGIDSGIDLEANNVAFISFYYRSASEFVGKDGATYTGADQRPTVCFNSDSMRMYDLSTGDTEGTEFKADDKWHRVTYYLPLTEAAEAVQLVLGFMQLDRPGYIQISGIRYGSLGLGSETPVSNKKAYTYLGQALQKGEFASITVDGTSVPMKDNVYEYTVSADSSSPSISVANVSGVEREAEVIRKKVTEYEIKVYSHGYDKLSPDDEEIPYMKSTTPDGVFDENAEGVRYTVKNSDQYTVYKLYLTMGIAEATIKVGGTETTDISSCCAGDSITIDETLLNVNNENLRFITLLTFYRGGDIVDIVPYEAVVTEEQDSVYPQYEYILGEGDYSGMSVDCFIINADTFGDVLK